MPVIKKYPTEIFGHPFCDKSILAKEHLKSQHCPYIEDECKKPRKSEPHIKIGTCSVGYKGSFQKKYSPVIICPHRLREQIVFDTIRELYLHHWKRAPEWVMEVDMGVGGNVDYVAVLRDELGEVRDFLCIEFQAAGTTGSPWKAILELKQHGKYLSNSYKYGINWANEFMKTMMQQVYKKGKIVHHWNRRIVFVVQDLAIDYLKSAVDTADLREANDDDEIHFVTFKMSWETDRWVLKKDAAYSTNLEGINRILGGSHADGFPTEEEFMGKIYSKGLRDNRF